MTLGKEGAQEVPTGLQKDSSANPARQEQILLISKILMHRSVPC